MSELPKMRIADIETVEYDALTYCYLLTVNENDKSIILIAKEDFNNQECLRHLMHSSSILFCTKEEDESELQLVVGI